MFTQWYKNDGYDITGDAAIDQEYIHERRTFENTDALVDRIFNRYLRHAGNSEPFFYVSQDNFYPNAVAMAEQGYNALEILRSLIQNDIQIVETLNIEGVDKQYPGFKIREGMNGEFVKHLQICLNRISSVNPEIPTTHDDGYFGHETAAAVKAFLHNESGAVDKPGWYKICFSCPKIRHAPGLSGAKGRFNIIEMALLLLISRFKK